jgi:hypothetical protein
LYTIFVLYLGIGRLILSLQRFTDADLC